MLDIMLDLERLRVADDGLRASIAEFERAAQTADGLEHAIGRPDERSRLRDRAHDFEGDWNDRRGILTENLVQIQKQLEAIIDGWTEWDAETCSRLVAQPVGATPSGTAAPQRVR